MWKETEVRYFVKYFDEIIIAPFSYGRNRNPKKLPEGVLCLEPVSQNILSVTSFKVKYIIYLINPRILLCFKEFFIKKVY